MRTSFLVFSLALLGFLLADSPSNARAPKDAQDLAKWMRNMIVFHKFTEEEIQAATGLTPEEIREARKTTDLSPRDEGLVPYPGGRHPRIGFLEGAVRPQRETKLSYFVPWNETSYVVADVPEAIWWEREDPETADKQGRELLYLAHTHVPTYWTRQGIELPPLEWGRDEGGAYVMKRKLPNGVEFGTWAYLAADRVLLEQWITNGTEETLKGLRVQNCVMLKGAPEFSAQTLDNKVFLEPFAACRDDEGLHWVITAWQHCVRSWGNVDCPCLHSDPKFPDCPPGETVRIRGWISFYLGRYIDAELDRIAEDEWFQE